MLYISSAVKFGTCGCAIKRHTNISGGIKIFFLITSISNRDFPVVQASVLYITAVVVVINFIVDIIYQLADPRIRTS